VRRAARRSPGSIWTGCTLAKTQVQSAEAAARARRTAAAQAVDWGAPAAEAWAGAAARAAVAAPALLGSCSAAGPWGKTDPGADALLTVYNCYYNANGACSNATNIAPVGSVDAGHGKWVQVDLSGNVSEWTLDDYPGPPYLADNGYLEPCTDCAFLGLSSKRMTRGGAFNSTSGTQVNVSFRVGRAPTDREATVGVRCARTP
jgi:formylglycine-generating enzyme required for sulfatase activity